MKYLLTIYRENDQYFKITGAKIEEDNYVVTPDCGYIETKNPELFNSISLLIKKTEIRYLATLSGEIQQADLIVDEKDELQFYKAFELNTAKNIISLRVNNIIVFNFFEFTMLNNYFMSKGIFITDENRQDKYLEIINTKDEELINKLESYLNTIDSIQMNMYLYTFYKDFESSLNEATTINEVNDAIEIFKKNFK